MSKSQNGSKDRDDISQLVQNANNIANEISRKEQTKSDDLIQIIQNANTIANQISRKKPVKKKKILSNVRRTYIARDENGRRSYPRPRKTLKKSRDSKVTDASSLYQSDESENDIQNDPLDGTFDTDIDAHNTIDSREITQQKSLQQILIDAFKLVGPTKKRKRQWKQRVENSEGLWCNERYNLTQILVQNNDISGLCDVCCENPALIRCLDCHNLQCVKCDDTIHDQTPLHNRITCVDYRQFLLPIESLNESTEIVLRKRILPLSGTEFCACARKLKVLVTDQKIIVVTSTGRYEVFKHQRFCEECQVLTDPFTLETILKSGYWPTTLSHINCIVSVDLFLQWDSYRKFMPGSSLNAFLRSLDSMTSKHGRVGKIVPATFATAFKQWCFVQHEMDVLVSENLMECPCCSVYQHSCHVDGNCKLYRYKTSGKRLRDCYYEDKFIVPDRKVDEFVTTIYKDSQPKDGNDYTCGGEWSAARNSGRKRGSIDYTGLEVATCRHQFGQKAVNMKRGEIYGYPLYLMKFFMVPNNVEFVFADVMCKLSKFVSSRDPSTFTKLKGALSVMHAKGHNADCQAVWDGEWVKGTGRSTGEEGEQLFSYLSRCSNTTKYQRPEHREEYITELVMFWNQRKSSVMSKSLCQKYIRVYKELEEFRSQQLDLTKRLNIDSNFEIDEIVEEIKATARGFNKEGYSSATKEQELLILYKSLPSNSKHKDGLSPMLKQRLDEIDWPDLSLLDIKVLKKRKCTQDKLLEKITDELKPEMIAELEKTTSNKIIIPALRTAIDRSRFELISWKAKVKKKATTCKQRFIFRRKQSQCTKKLESLLQKLTKFSNDVISLESPFPWDCQFKLLPNISCTDRRTLAEICLKIRRSEEELILLRRDAASFVTYQKSKLEELSQKCLVLETASDSYSKGLLMMIRETIIVKKQKLEDGIKLFNETFSLNLHFDPHPDSEQAAPMEAEIDEVDGDGEENEDDDEDDDEDEREFETENPDQSDDFDLSLIMELGRELSGPSPISQIQIINGTEIFLLNDDLAQGTINGRNGSIACSLISLIAAYSNLARLDVSDVSQLVSGYIGAMELGNNVFTNTFSEMPELPEAVESLSEFTDIVLKEENTIFFPNDSNVILDFVNNLQSNEAIILIYSGKMVHLTRRGDKFYFFDSHCHGNFGAVILIGSDAQTIFPYLSDDESIYMNIGVVSFLF